MADNKPVDTGEKTVTGRTIWNDPETGEDYSERSTTFEIDGKFYTMPTVSEDGRQHTEDQIRNYVKENGPIDYLTGEELPEFRYIEDAIEYAISRSSTRKQTDMAQGGAIPMNNQMELFGDGGLKDEGGTIDEVSGNEVPVGGTKEGVRDDIPANVSEGEFIFPEDVVRFVGLDKLMQIRQDAKMGLKKMEAMGQMGNSDEATMDDDMPFSMADLVVVGGKGEPMEFAGGGFIPVEDYTVVQDMIADRSDKAAAIDKDKAMSDMIADNTTKSAVIEKAEPEEEVQSFAPGGSVQGQGSLPSWLKFTAPEGTAVTQAAVNHTNPLTGETYVTMTGGYSIDYDNLGTAPTKGPQELETAYVPTFSPDEITDYDAYMNNVTIEVKVYINASGEKINITFINGVPTTPIEDGYTLYVAPEEGAEVSPEEVIAQTINNSNNNNRDNEPYSESSIKPINYGEMSPEDFAARMEYESTKGYKLQKAFALGVSSLVPFGAGLAYGSMRSHARQSEIRLNEMIASAATPELKSKYTTIRDNFLKANSLLPSSESGVIAKWVDGILVGSGINPEAAADAASAVNGITQVGSLSTEQTDALAKILADPASEIYTGSTNVTARPASYDPAQFGSGDPSLNTSAVAPSTNIVPSASDTELGKFSGSPSASTDFKNLSTEDQMNVLKNKRAIDRYGSLNDKSITKDLNPDEMQALQNLQMTQGTRASFDNTYRGADRISKAAGGSKVEGGPAPAPVQTGDPNIVTDTSNVGQRPATYDPFQFGSGEPVAQKKSNDGLFQQKTIAGFGNKILDLVQGNYFKKEETPSVTSTEPYTPQQFTNQFAVPNQQLPESIAQQTQSAFTGSEVPASVADSSRMLKINQPLGGGQQETFSPVVTTDPRGTSAGDLGYSSLNQANTTTDTSTQFTKPDVNLTAPMVDPRTNVLTTPAVYPEGMDPSKIKYAPPKVSETPIITTPKVPNTTYQDVANRLTPGDGKKYVNGVLLDDSGNPVNSLYQQTANLFTPFDGKEYKNGVLIDSETRKPITQTAQAATVVQPERTEVWKDKLTGSALRAAQDAEKAGYTGSTVNDFAIGVISDGKTKGVLADAEGKVVRDANNRTVYVDAEGNQYVKTDIFGMSTETPTGTVATQKEDSGQSKQVDPVVKVSPPPAKKEDKSGEREANRAANKAAAKAEKTQQNAGRTESVEQKIKRGGGFNKGGLASKPKTKKTKTTNKRGLAARK